MLATLAACSNQMQFSPGSAEGGSDRLTEQGIRIIPVTVENIAQYNFSAMPVQAVTVRAPRPPRDPQPYRYRIGPGDVLRIQTWTTPERVNTSDDLQIPEGVVVDEGGRIFYPFVGPVSVVGRTASQVRTNLTERLRRFIAEPQVEVSVESFNSARATVLGSVGEAKSIPLTNVPVRLLDVVGGATGDLRQVEIRRKGHTFIVNLQSYMVKGTKGQNPIILPGDVVFVSPLVDNKIYTFGEVGAGEIELTPGGLSMTDVLAKKGGLNDQRSNVRGVFVFRRRPDTPEQGFDVFQFNMEDATALVMATDFAMQPLDIVFVTTDPVTRWNDIVLRLIAPISSLVVLREVPDTLDND